MILLNNFYWKTFLRFCALSLVLILTSSAVYFAFFYENPHAAPNRPLFNSFASAAVSVYEYGGPHALANWLEELEKQRNIHMYILNRNNHDVLGRTVPLPIMAAIKERTSLQASLPPHFIGSTKSKNKKNSHYIFTHVVSHKGLSYFIVTDIPPQKYQRDTPANAAQIIGLRLFIVIIMGGLLCVWITWYLTRPVSKLRKATQEWSSGNLAARVGVNLGNRQDEISALGRDLDKMAERLQVLMQNQQRLLTDVSHELRTPLARLQIALGLARQRSGDIVRAELDRIELEAERLNEMIGQILSLVRLGAATQAENIEEVNIVELLKTIISNAEFENSEGHKSVLISGDERIPNITANSQLIYSALENIIRNAFRYTPENTTIEVNIYCPIPSQLEITIRDHGPGVPEKELDKIFEPFFRVAAARDRNSGGYGLGLAIAKRAIEVHEGKITASNVATGGLMITIVLPV